MTETTERPYVLQSDDYYGLTYPLPREYVNDFMASEEDKWAVLEGMGILPNEDLDHEQSPLARWRDAVADHSNIPRQQLDPTRGGRMNLGFSPIDVRHFVWFLA